MSEPILLIGLLLNARCPAVSGPICDAQGRSLPYPQNAGRTVGHRSPRTRSLWRSDPEGVCSILNTLCSGRAGHRWLRASRAPRQSSAASDGSRPPQVQRISGVDESGRTWSSGHRTSERSIQSAMLKAIVSSASIDGILANRRRVLLGEGLMLLQVECPDSPTDSAELLTVQCGAIRGYSALDRGKNRSRPFAPPQPRLPQPLEPRLVTVQFRHGCLAIHDRPHVVPARSLFVTPAACYAPGATTVCAVLNTLWRAKARNLVRWARGHRATMRRRQRM